jgi:hypothetical protein
VARVISELHIIIRESFTLTSALNNISFPQIPATAPSFSLKGILCTGLASAMALVWGFPDPCASSGPSFRPPTVSATAERAGQRSRFRQESIIFYIWLTVHLGTVLVNNQLGALFQCIYLFHLSTCFEEPSAHHQENQLY